MLKFCAFLSLCASMGLAGEFVTGQGARLVLGQKTFTAQTPGASDTLVGGVGGLAYAADTLFVADSNRIGFLPSNNRILVFQNLSQTLPAPQALIQPFSGRCPVCLGKAGLVLGQPDFLATSFHISRSGLRVPTAVATDGRILAVADTENNRVLIWNTIPNINGQPADLVLGQPDFNTIQPLVATASSFRGPQGVWIQNGRIFVADTQNNRVMIWNSIPTKNNQPADLVLGQANFTTVSEVPAGQADLRPTSSNILNPVSVTSDGTHVFVADLGYNRVLIWNSIPTRNQQPADVEIGQKDFETAEPNDATHLCPSGTDPDGKTFYPARCGNTMDYPRFALSDGRRLFVADGGNDRVLVFNTIPTQNAAHADVVLGQPDEFSSVVTSVADLFHPLLKQSAADLTPTPTSLAWDGTNLYVTDPSNRRILVFTAAEPNLPITAVRNAASREIYATGEVDINGTVKANDTVTITIAGKAYTYKVVADDTIATILQKMVDLINAGSGDPNVFAIVVPQFSQVKLTSRRGGTGGNEISLNSSVSTNAQITALTSGTTLSGGESASTVAPGTVVSFFGDKLADSAVQADVSSGSLPLELGGVQVYFDGIRAPIFFVSPGQVNAQIPWEVSDSNSISAYLRTTHADGSVTVTNAVGVPIAPQNPGIFAEDGADPRFALAYHSSSYATGTITVSGSIQANDVGTVTIEDRAYSYTVQATDTLATVRDALIALINASRDEKVRAQPGAAYTRILLRSKIPGPEGNNIPISTSSTNPNSGTSAVLSLGVSDVKLCCANIAGARITPDNPALPGETILVYATGLGLVFNSLTSEPIGPLDGTVFPNVLNSANSTVSSQVDTKTANVLAAGLKPGSIGIYEVMLELNPDIPTDSLAQVTISQDIYTSNIVTIPVGNPNFPPPL